MHLGVTRCNGGKSSRASSKSPHMAQQMANAQLYVLIKNNLYTQIVPDSSLANKIAQCRKIVKQLLKLCNFPIKNNTKQLSLHDVFPALQQCTPCDLLIPVQHSLIASLPPTDVNFAQHQPFPSDLPFITSTLPHPQ